MLVDHQVIDSAQNVFNARATSTVLETFDSEAILVMRSKLEWRCIRRQIDYFRFGKVPVLIEDPVLAGYYHISRSTICL